MGFSQYCTLWAKSANVLQEPMKKEKEIEEMEVSEFLGQSLRPPTE